MGPAATKADGWFAIGVCFCGSRDKGQGVTASLLLQRDIIAGFQAGVDLIDLTRIDANVILTGNQAFSFIGTAVFGNIAGQLRLVTGANSILQGDVDGDGLADFELQLNGIATVSVNDLLL